MSSKSQEEEDFEYWLANMDEFLDAFFEATPDNISSKLNYSPDSLNVIEAYILDTYNSIDEIMAPSEAEKLNALSIYVGETFRKGLGGKWGISFDDEDDADYGVPTLVGFGVDEETIAPLFLVTACIDRRRGSYFRSIFDANSPG